jgi:hypothetical protein
MLARIGFRNNRNLHAVWISIPGSATVCLLEGAVNVATGYAENVGDGGKEKKMEKGEHLAKVKELKITSRQEMGNKR